MLTRFMEMCAEASQKFCPQKKQGNQKAKSIIRERRMLMSRSVKINKQLAAKPTEGKRHKLNSETVEIKKKLLKSYKDERLAMEDKAVSAVKKNSNLFFLYVNEFC